MIDSKKKEECCGCSACANVCPTSCITMKQDQEGFIYPRVDHTKCVDCKKCEMVCPVITHVTRPGTSRAYACINKDENVRLESSSGGVFSVLAKSVIERKGVVFGAVMNEKMEVEHSCCTKSTELYKLRGTKYVQSSIGTTYTQVKEYLRNNKIVLFTGTPCQVEGLRSYLGKDYDNLLLVDLICHGVPSDKVWKAYMYSLEEKYRSKVSKVNFRNKQFGWNHYCLEVTMENGKILRERVGRDYYLRAFLSEGCLRPSCYECKFRGEHRNCDLTLADFWGVDKKLPEFYDQKGTSLVIVHSEKGHHVMDFIQAECKIREVKLEIVKEVNPSFIRSEAPHRNRKQFMESLGTKPFPTLVTTYFPKSKISNIKGWIPDSLKAWIKQLVK